MPLWEFVVLKIVKLFTGCWRNITTNFFMNASRATKSLAKRTTLFWTILSNRRELFHLAKSVKDELGRFSRILHETSNCTLTIYKSRTAKKVSILKKET